MIQDFALIIGSMKAGTTSLFNYLAQHPEIAACKHKEPHFFSKANRFEKGREYYESLWDWQEDTHKLALEASAGYTGFHPDKTQKNLNRLYAADSIDRFKSDYGVNFKFIYILRNPIAKLESHYNHVKAWKYRDCDLPPEVMDRLIDGTKYAMQIEQYYQRFPESDILLLNFDDLINNPKTLMAEVCRFLELDPSYEFQGLGVNHNSYRRKKRIKIPGWYRFRSNELVHSLVMSVPKDLKYSFRNLFGKKIDSQYKKFSESEKTYIIQRIADDLAKLADKYQFDISSWNLDLPASSLK